MSEGSKSFANCHSCENSMEVSSLAPFTNAVCPTCGAHTRVKCEFGPYTLVRRHAVGGMSMVFQAHDTTLGREVALKILSEEFSADKTRIAAFEEEARITASFSHPHVVRVLTTGRAFDRFYIAMEMVPGGHFEHQIRERGKIPELEMLPLAIEVARGLKAAHAAGLIHRDVKPGNILLDSEGHAKLVDFGLALVTQGGVAQATEIWATPYYVPPETIEGKPEDFRSDVYAFGATLYHALAGKPSCDQETMVTEDLRDAKQRIIPLKLADPSLSSDLCLIVDRAMAYRPDQRFGSYDELIEQLALVLKRLKSGVSSDFLEKKAARRQARKKRTQRIVGSAVTVVVLSALSLSLWWVMRDEPVVPKASSLASMGLVPSDALTAPPVDIAKTYRDARVAVEVYDFSKAANGFARLFEDSRVQEPTRTWAGVEAVLAHYLDGAATEARMRAMKTSAHLQTPDATTHQVGDVLKNSLRAIENLAGVSAKPLDTSKSDAAHVLSWMLVGLKNWEQGLLVDAGIYFSAVESAKISPNESWLKIYQKMAGDYLADLKVLTSEVFRELPLDVKACEQAVSELNLLLKEIKTRGRARFNIRAWQLDLARQAKLLKTPSAPIDTTTAAIPVGEWVSAEALAKVMELSKACRFAEASKYLKSFPSDPNNALCFSLLALSSSAADFLTDLQSDLSVQAASGEFALKSGAIVREISVNAEGGLVISDGRGQSQNGKWADFSADALIALHRICVKKSMSENERMRRHECAIAYGWLAGSRESALSAAAALSQSNEGFRQRWAWIVSGLPR